jgi:hypothetical protein
MRSLPIWLVWGTLIFATFATLTAGCGGTTTTTAAGHAANAAAIWDESRWDDAAWAQ